MSLPSLQLVSHPCNKFRGTPSWVGSGEFHGCPESKTILLLGDFLAFLVSPASICPGAQSAQQQPLQAVPENLSSTATGSVLSASLSPPVVLQEASSLQVQAPTIHAHQPQIVNQPWSRASFSIIQWAATTPKRAESQSWGRASFLG